MTEPQRPAAIEIQVYGRTGDDTDLMGDMLAEALRSVGYHVRTLAAHDARHTFLAVRAARTAIEVRASERSADALLVLDVELLGEIPPAALTRPGLVVVDAPGAPCSRLPGAAAVHDVDATAVAQRHGPGATAVAALLGAFAGASNLIPVEALIAAVERLSPVAAHGNADACIDAYTEAMDMVRE
jgi:Pyruvate/2-oxoacid:ferredoxin oxidoreductase gamma subunit